MIGLAERLQVRIAMEWKNGPIQATTGLEPAVYCQVFPDQLPEFCSFVARILGGTLATVVGSHEKNAVTLLYVFSVPDEHAFIGVRASLDGANRSFRSVTPVLRAAHWAERELHDLFGVVPSGHPSLARLVLHPDWPVGVHPFDREFDRFSVVPRLHVSEPAVGSQRDGEFELPFGPIRAGVVESAHFRFLTVGEEIRRLEMQLFYKHRGIERLFEGQPIALCPLIAERISGISSFAHSLAFCQAVEQATRIDVPVRAQLLRTIYAELERLYNHMGNLANLAEVTSLRVAQAQCSLLQERIKQLNARLVGHRFLRGVNTIGGLRRDLSAGALDDLLRSIDYLGRECIVLIELLLSTKSHLDRLVGTGVLPEKVARDYGAVGPVARGSGLKRDLRHDHPYAAYATLTLNVPVYHYGDALARMRVRMDEISESLQLIRDAASRLEPGPILAELPAFSGGQEAIGYAESPRGAIVTYVAIGEDGTLRRCKIRSPSFSNWYLFQTTVENTMMMDWPINERSFELTHAGCDL
jgi:Ni,Fe-hydrogenase III large subunit/Ni,Fe-hydrogenase III component G